VSPGEYAACPGQQLVMYAWLGPHLSGGRSVGRIPTVAHWQQLEDHKKCDCGANWHGGRLLCRVYVTCIAYWNGSQEPAALIVEHNLKL
jgi:hypothetical protein